MQWTPNGKTLLGWCETLNYVLVSLQINQVADKISQKS
jgi:hypothetical protein